MPDIRLTSAILGVILLALGIVNTILMAELLGRRRDSAAARRAHRVMGWLFVAGVVFGFGYMFRGAGHFGGFPVYVVIHGVAGIVLLPLAVAKLLVARRYKAYMAALPVLGLSTLICAFVTIMTASGPIIMGMIYP